MTPVVTTEILDDEAALPCCFMCQYHAEPCLMDCAVHYQCLCRSIWVHGACFDDYQRRFSHCPWCRTPQPPPPTKLPNARWLFDCTGALAGGLLYLLAVMLVSNVVLISAVL